MKFEGIFDGWFGSIECDFTALDWNIELPTIHMLEFMRSVTYGHLLIPRWFYNPGTHNFDDSKLNQPAAGAKKIQDVIFWNRCFWHVGSVGGGWGGGGYPGDLVTYTLHARNFSDLSPMVEHDFFTQPFFSQFKSTRADKGFKRREIAWISSQDYQGYSI